MTSHNSTWGLLSSSERESLHSKDLRYQFVNVTLGNFQELFNTVDRLLDKRGIVLSA